MGSAPRRREGEEDGRTEGHDIGEDGESTVEQEEVLHVDPRRQQLHLPNSFTLVSDDHGAAGIARRRANGALLRVELLGRGRDGGHGDDEWWGGVQGSRD